LVQSPLSNALKRLAVDGVMNINQSGADWIQDQFADLIRHAPTTTGKFSKPWVSQAERRDQGYIQRANFGRIVLSRQRHDLETASGMLTLESMECKDMGGRRSQIFRFRFLPGVRNLSQSNISISATFLQNFTAGSARPKFTRVVQTYNVIPDDAEVFTVIRHDDVCKLREMLEAGQASIFDIDEDGNSLLMVRSLEFIASLPHVIFREPCASLKYIQYYGPHGIQTKVTLMTLHSSFHFGCKGAYLVP